MDYIKALEEERKKILVFERELPLSLQLITQAIESCNKEFTGSEDPILEEFIPLRPSCSSSDDEEIKRNDDKKPDWLRSVKLWNQQPDHKKDGVSRPIAVNVTRFGGAFHPFERSEKAAVKPPPSVAVVAVAEAPASSTSTENNNGGSVSRGEEKEKEEHSQRKARRCWSPELHRRFLHALQQLGGSHAATPKQIRELMKVDGLTNDEIKSHLQKYRLHSRRPATSAVHSSTTSNSHGHQIMLVGGIWIPPPEYTTAVAAAAAAATVDTTSAPSSNTIYAPVASLPSKKISTGSLNTKGRYGNSDNAERTNSDSSATTVSSSQTTTASPPF